MRKQTGKTKAASHPHTFSYKKSHGAAAPDVSCLSQIPHLAVLVPRITEDMEALASTLSSSASSSSSSSSPSLSAYGGSSSSSGCYKGSGGFARVLLLEGSRKCARDLCRAGVEREFTLISIYLSLSISSSPSTHNTIQYNTTHTRDAQELEPSSYPAAMEMEMEMTMAPIE